MNKYRACDLSDAEIEDAVRDYQLGVSSNDIAVSLGVAPGTVLRWVREAGIRIRTKAEAGALARERKAQP